MSGLDLGVTDDAYNRDVAKVLELVGQFPLAKEESFAVVAPRPQVLRVRAVLDKAGRFFGLEKVPADNSGVELPMATLDCKRLGGHQKCGERSRSPLQSCK